jgi:hypothetical protein
MSATCIHVRVRGCVAPAAGRRVMRLNDLVIGRVGLLQRVCVCGLRDSDAWEFVGQPQVHHGAREHNVERRRERGS